MAAEYVDNANKHKHTKWISLDTETDVWKV